MGITNVRDIRYLTNNKIDYRTFNDGHTAGLAYCTIEEWNESYIECEDSSHSDYLSPKIDLIKLDTSKSYVWEYNTSSWEEDDVLSQWSVNYFNDYHILYGLTYDYTDGWRVYTDASYTSDRRVNIYQNDFYTLPYNWANMPINQTITHTYTNQPLECNVMSTGIDDFCDYTDADTTRNGKVTNITTWSVNYSWTVPDQDKSGVGTINESTSFITKSGKRLYKVGQLNVSMSVYMRAIITTNSTTGLYEVRWSNSLYNSTGINKVSSSTAAITSVEANPRGTIETTETINFLYEEGSGSNVNPQLLGWDYVLNTLSVPGFLKKYTVGTTSTIGALAIKKNYSTASTNYPSITLATSTTGNLWSSQVRTNKGRDLTYYSNVGINSTSAPVLTYNSWDWTTYPSSHKYKLNVGVRNMYEFPIVYTTNDDLWDIYLGGLSVATSILFFTQTWSVTNTGANQKNNTTPIAARINFSYRPLYTNSVTTQSISQTLTGSAFPHITNIGMGHNDMWVYYRNSSASTSPIHQILESASDVSEYRHGYREYNVDGSTDELSQSANLLVNLGSSTISPENSVAASDHALYQYIFPADQATSTTAAQNVSVNWTNDTTQGSFYEIGMRGPQTGQTVHTYNSTSSLKNWILAEAYGSDISTASNPAHRTYSIANSKNIITYSRKFNNVFLELINVGNLTSETITNFRYDKLTFTFNVHCLDTTDTDAQISNAYMICGIGSSLKKQTRTNGPTWATQTIAGFAMIDDDAYWNKPLFKDYSGSGTPTCFTTIDSISAATYQSISNITTTRQTITADCYCGVKLLKLPISGGPNYYYSPFIPITLFWKETGNNLLEDRYYVKYYGLFYKDLTYTTAANWTTRDNWYLVPLDVNYRSGAITWKCWHQQKYSSELPFSTSGRTITLNPFYFFKDLYNSNSGTWIGGITPYFYREWATSSTTIEVTKLILTPPSSYTSTNVPASITYRCGGTAAGKVYIDFYALALLSNNSADTMSSIFNHSYSLAQ